MRHTSADERINEMPSDTDFTLLVRHIKEELDSCQKHTLTPPAHGAPPLPDRGVGGRKNQTATFPVLAPDRQPPRAQSNFHYRHFLAQMEDKAGKMVTQCEIQTFKVAPVYCNVPRLSY